MGVWLHFSSFPGPLIFALASFKFFRKKKISNSKCTTGVNDANIFPEICVDRGEGAVNLTPLSTTPAVNLPPLSATLAVNLPAAVSNTGGEFAAAVSDTGGELAAPVSNTGGEFAAAVSHTGGEFAATPLSATPAVIIFVNKKRCYYENQGPGER
jgi:hypothetical protein